MEEKNNQQNNNQAVPKNSEEGSTEKTTADKLESCMKEKEEYLNGWKRAKADLINYQKEEAKRFEEILRYGTIELLKDFIPVMDSFDLALTVLEKEGKAERGVYMIRTQLEDALKKRGLDRMIIEKGKPFDPSLHESIGEVESDYSPGTIAEEIERGYILNGRVVRPARVKLSKLRTNN